MRHPRRNLSLSLTTLLLKGYHRCRHCTTLFHNWAKQGDTARKETEHQKWTGIQSYNNFEFQRSGIRVWKAYGIGKGKQIHNQEIKRMARPQGKTGLIVHEEFSDPIADKGAFKKQEPANVFHRVWMRPRMLIVKPNKKDFPAQKLAV